MAAARKAVTTRPAIKQGQIVDEIRRKIVHGDLTPGSRLPTRIELKEHYGVSTTTIQGALSQLQEDGFVVALGRQGSYVAENPPHLSRYVVVTPVHPSDKQGWSHFWTALVNEAEKVNQSGGHSLDVFTGISPDKPTPEFRQLIEDVQAHRVAGLIFTFHPYRLLSTPLMDEPGIARVAVAEPTELPGVSSVYPKLESFVTRSVEYLAQRGRKKLGLLTAIGSPNDKMIRLYEDAVAANGMTMRPAWVQSVHKTMAEWASHAVQAVFDRSNPDRPDCLVITDDNLVPYATAGVIGTGLRVPQDLEVIGSANFPWPTHSALPITRLGFDAGALVRACLDSIDLHRRDGIVSGHTDIPAIFDNEMAERNRFTVGELMR